MKSTHHLQQQHHHHAPAKSAVHEHKPANGTSHSHLGDKHQTTHQQEHHKHIGHHTEDFLKRFWISVGLTIPLLLVSHMIQQWLDFHIRFRGDNYLLLALGSMIYFYGGWPFLVGMVREVRYRNLGMMTLVALAITVSYVYSVAVVFGLTGMDFFWELATLIDIMLLGHWIEMRSEMSASNALKSLVALLPSVVHVQRNGAFIDTDLKDLKDHDTVLIKPGEKVPADGLILDGTSFVNESMLTGESVPIKKQKGAEVIGGSINGDGALTVKITGTGTNGYLNKVITLVQSAQQSKSNTQNLADKVAKWLTITSIVIGIATFTYWYTIQKDLAIALERLVTVMVTSCPHALGVAIPLVVAISTTKAAVSGLLIRNRTAFENARKLTTIIFDKTGTLTKGTHEVQHIVSVDETYTSDHLLQYAAAAEQSSEHYIARGIQRKLQEKNLPLWKSTNFEYNQGIGVSAIVNGKLVLVVGQNYFKDNDAALPNLPGAVDQATQTVSFILVENKLAGIITLADTIRENSRLAITRLKQMSIKSFLLTGDNEKIAASVAGKLGMDGYLANVLPHQKQEKVKEFQ